MDGFDCVTNTAYEFNGCRYHGHFCMENKKLKDVRTGFSMADLQRLTVKNDIKSLGYKLKSIYECDFDRTVKSDPKLAEFIGNLDVPKRMSLRDNFYGELLVSNYTIK